MRVTMRGPRLTLPVRQAAIAASVAILVLIAISFARVIIVEYQLNLQKQELQNDIRQLQSKNRDLQAKIDDLQTDAAIERLARKSLGWTKPGDTAVVIVSTSTVSTASVPSSTRVTAKPASPWQKLWSAVTGGNGPDQ